MKTKSTTASSLTFAELQARATKGPYFTDETFRHVMTAEGVVFDVRPTDNPKHSIADVERAMRLLNAAHAGLFDALMGCDEALMVIRDDKHRAEYLADPTMLDARIRKCLAILGGLQP